MKKKKAYLRNINENETKFWNGFKSVKSMLKVINEWRAIHNLWYMCIDVLADKEKEGFQLLFEINDRTPWFSYDATSVIFNLLNYYAARCNYDCDFDDVFERFLEHYEYEGENIELSDGTYDHILKVWKKN